MEQVKDEAQKAPDVEPHRGGSYTRHPITGELKQVEGHGIDPSQTSDHEATSILFEAKE